MASDWPVGERRFLGLKRRQAIVVATALLALGIGAAVSAWVFRDEVGGLVGAILFLSLLSFLALGGLFTQFGFLGLAALPTGRRRPRDR